jgi:formylglycine-generating enzyme required for sulfatase activity
VRALDELSLEGGTVYDLAGNLSEWTLDAWDTSEGPCWNAARIYTDPICGDVARALYRAVRGGTWYGFGTELAAVTRLMIDTEGYAVADGFRCARPDSP